MDNFSVLVCWSKSPGLLRSLSLPSSLSLVSVFVRNPLL